MKRISTLFVLALMAITEVWSQGIGIPSKRGGIGFGNLPRFVGIRFNFIDRNVEQLYGANITVWNAKDTEQQTGNMAGISIGLPMAMGLENQSGISIGILGAGAKQNLSGINIGGLGLGAGGAVRGINLAGLGIGSGGDLSGVSIAALGVGSGGNVRGFNFGGLGVGAGGSLAGINIGGLGIGSGGDVTGINIGGLGVGAGEDITGLSVAVLGIGAGGKVRGLTVAGVGIGSGESLQGISIACIAAGSPSVAGLTIAPVVGGLKVKGIVIAPAWLRVGDGKLNKNREDGAPVEDGELTGITVSAYNRIKGLQRGVAFGVVNYTQDIRGAQFGLINIVRDNPKGLRVLPIFNTRFGRKRG